MSDIKAGIIIKQDFVGTKTDSDTKEFNRYINYIDRENATGLENYFTNIEKGMFENYQDYMYNENKTSSLFNSTTDELNKNNRDDLKSVFKQAQEKGSLMWRTVISFDNRFLKENGLLTEDGFDEIKMKSYTRQAIDKMLKSEGFIDPVWSAAFHFNTDNVHCHIATVDPGLSREKKEYKQFEDKDRKIPLKDENGQIVYKEEFVGRFKQSSLNRCKSSIVNSIIEDKGLNQSINEIIRNRILGDRKNNPLLEDKEMSEGFLNLVNSLPFNKSLWKYNMNAMDEYRQDVDNISKAYIEKYHGKDFINLKAALDKQQEIYSRAYGGNNNYFTENKIQDLYTRLGNSILSEAREYAKTDEYKIAHNLSLYKKGFKNNNNQNNRTNKLQGKNDLRLAMYHLKKSMQKNYEDWKAINEYDKELERSLSNGIENDNEL